MTDVLRRVTPPQPDTISPPSSITGIRNRMPHWTSKAPAHAGWWAVRWRNNRVRREIMYVAEPKQPSALLEFSDRAYQWPLEQDMADPDGTTFQEWTRPGSPLVRYIPDEEEPDKHKPGYWIFFGWCMGVSCGVAAMYALEWLAMHH